MYTLVERKEEPVYGWITTLLEESEQDKVPSIVRQKEIAHVKYDKSVQPLYAVNALIDHAQCYLIGNMEEESRPSQFLMPKGSYARFESKEDAPEALDKWIRESYGELMGEGKYQLAGNFNLEEYHEDGTVSLYLPVK